MRVYKHNWPSILFMKNSWWKFLTSYQRVQYFYSLSIFSLAENLQLIFEIRIRTLLGPNIHLNILQTDFHLLVTLVEI